MLRRSQGSDRGRCTSRDLMIFSSNILRKDVMFYELDSIWKTKKHQKPRPTVQKPSKFPPPPNSAGGSKRCIFSPPKKNKAFGQLQPPVGLGRSHEGFGTSAKAYRWSSCQKARAGDPVRPFFKLRETFFGGMFLVLPFGYLVFVVVFGFCGLTVCLCSFLFCVFSMIVCGLLVGFFILFVLCCCFFWFAGLDGDQGQAGRGWELSGAEEARVSWQQAHSLGLLIVPAFLVIWFFRPYWLEGLRGYFLFWGVSLNKTIFCGQQTSSCFFSMGFHNRNLIMKKRTNIFEM